jgi:hypothetical protein
MFAGTKHYCEKCLPTLKNVAISSLSASFWGHLCEITLHNDMHIYLVHIHIDIYFEYPVGKPEKTGTSCSPRDHYQRITTCTSTLSVVKHRRTGVFIIISLFLYTTAKKTLFQPTSSPSRQTSSYIARASIFIFSNAPIDRLLFEP